MQEYRNDEETKTQGMNSTESQGDMNKARRIMLVSVLVLGVLCGWLLGSFVPVPGTQDISHGIQASQVMSSADKESAIRKIMEEEWYFANQIEDLDKRLTDQSLYGMTNNEEDPHTSYMSAEEIESFMQSINRNFVGIGVEFIASNGINLIEKVFKNSPAEQYGIQAGDLIMKVDGVDVVGMSASEIRDLVQGEIGSTVTLTVDREGKSIDIDIVRGSIAATAFGFMLKEDTAFLELHNFGDSSADEIKSYLDDCLEKGAKKLIIDLRDNGGGYLDSLEKTASLFLPRGTIIMRSSYADGSETLTTARGGNYTQFEKYVILINNGTASAAEVFTLAMKENLDNVTVLGEKSYGKGTVQVSKYFEDGSAIKVTQCRWLSPNGTWINNVGIEPDETVLLHPVMYESFSGMEDDQVFRVDQVARVVLEVQESLDYLGYEVDRKDGYFSENTSKAITLYQQDHDLEATGELNAVTYRAIISSVKLDWTSSKSRDLQVSRALEVLGE